MVTISLPDLTKLIEPAVLDAMRYITVPDHVNRRDLRISIWTGGDPLGDADIRVVLTHRDERIAPMVHVLFGADELRRPLMNMDLKDRLAAIVAKTIDQHEVVKKILGIDKIPEPVWSRIANGSGQLRAGTANSGSSGGGGGAGATQTETFGA